MDRFKESTRLTHEIGHDRMLAASLFNLAELAHGTNRPRPAACLLGALASRLDARPDLPGFDLGEFARQKAEVRDSLDVATFDAAWREGCAMRLAQAKAYALREL